MDINKPPDLIHIGAETGNRMESEGSLITPLPTHADQHSLMPPQGILTVVGVEKSGKTSLTQGIIQNLPSRVDQYHRTHVVNTDTWKAPNGRTILFYDVGDHHTYKATYHVLLSQNSRNQIFPNLFLIVHHLDDGDIIGTFDTWKHVLTFSVNSNVWLILTHVDKLDPRYIKACVQNFQKEFFCHLDQEIVKLENLEKEFIQQRDRNNDYNTDAMEKHRNMLIRYKQFHESMLIGVGTIHVVSNKTFQGIQQLQQAIMRNLDQQNRNMFSEVVSDSSIQPVTMNRGHTIVPVRLQSLYTSLLKYVRQIPGITNTTESIINQFFIKTEVVFNFVVVQFGSVFSRDDFNLCLRYMHSCQKILWLESSPVLQNAIFRDPPAFINLLKLIFPCDIQDTCTYEYMDQKLGMALTGQNVNKEIYNQCKSEWLTQGIMKTDFMKILTGSVIDNTLMPVYTELLNNLNIASPISGRKYAGSSLFVPWFTSTNKNDPHWVKNSSNELHRLKASSPNDMVYHVVIRGAIPSVCYNLLCVSVHNMSTLDVTKHVFHPGHLILYLPNETSIYLEDRSQSLSNQSTHDLGVLSEKNKSHDIHMYVKTAVSLPNIRSAWKYVTDVNNKMMKICKEWFPDIAMGVFIECGHCLISECSSAMNAQAGGGSNTFPPKESQLSPEIKSEYRLVSGIINSICLPGVVYTCGRETDVPQALLYPLQDETSDLDTRLCVGEIKTYLEHKHLNSLHLNQPPQSTGEWNRWNQEYRETTFNQRKEYFRDFSTKQLAEAGLYATDTAGEMRCVSCDFLYNTTASIGHPVTLHKTNYMQNCRFLQEAYNASGVSGDSLGRQFDTLNIAPERPPQSDDATYEPPSNPPVRRDYARLGDNTQVVAPPPRRVAYTDYRLEASRLESFEHWPRNAPVDPADLANAGFFYLGISDRVQCHFCRGILSNWDPGDRALPEHMRHFPACRFLEDPAQVGNVPIGEEQRDVMFSNVHIRPALTDSPKATEAAIREGILTVRPIHPDYAVVQKRLKTFASYPSNTWHTGDQLSEAGFYYTGRTDEVACFFCDIHIKDWIKRDKPWILHAMTAPSCGFLRLIQGDDFIDKVQADQDAIKSRLATEKPRPRKIRSKIVVKHIVTRVDMERAMMSLTVTQAVEMGCDLEVIKKLIHRRLAELGDMFPNVESLLDACQEYDEEGGDSEPEEASQVPESPADLPPVSPQDEGSLCKVCFVNMASVVLLNCGHFVCCASCSASLDICPVCRERIMGRIKVEN